MTKKRTAAQDVDAVMSLEELARRMLAMPTKQRAELVKKKPKPRKK